MATTYKHLVYLVLDELKINSDDAYFNEDHVIFLLNKYRGLLLKAEYKDIKKEIPESNYQTMCLTLSQVPAISGEECEGGVYLKTDQKIPSVLSISTPKIYPEDYYQGTITYVSRERMRYVGHNKWLQNIIYASIGPDNYMYFKSSNPQYLYLRSSKITAVFEHPEEIIESNVTTGCDESNSTCDILDSVFPLEEALIPKLVMMVVKELSRPEYLPEDKQNNSNDDLAGLSVYNGTRRNKKADTESE